MMNFKSRMKNSHDIDEDEIRVIGTGNQGGKSISRRWWWIGGAAVVAILVIVLLLVLGHKEKQGPQLVEEPVTEEPAQPVQQWFSNIDASLPSCTVVQDTLIDSIHMKIYTPYNVVPELHVGWLDTVDKDIVLAHRAADTRRDNGRIVGAFVCEGKPMSWGLSKKGYCAIIDGQITLGVSENSPLFEQATEKEGYFFRQYPSVAKGVAISNNPQNAATRRALCVLNGKVCIIGCTDRVLMNDFSIALVKLGVSDAILLVGSVADGWYRDGEGNLASISTYPSKSRAKRVPYISYIVFRKQ